ncbi:hypothetical protein OG249_36490 [Streptomyces microflavus]|uniref:hypothetical protein n=1 Tax=Streptomyces microflavus TaxID=1919 RepID=UPI00225486D9|nr:hypothetical protein [Streptomyces microflavus]MCX4657363.1 hypothetical protein [Streptomyces microflavus]
MAADIYTRYMAASDAWSAHLKGCQCTAEQPCPAGAPLRERFSDLQDAYLTHLREKKGTP